MVLKKNTLGLKNQNNTNVLFKNNCLITNRKRMLPKMKIQKTAIVFSTILLALVSCKSSYTRIGDENANYIPYYLKVYEADSLFIVGDYQRSYEILDSLFKKYEPLDIDIYYEYKTYLISKHKTGRHITKKEFEQLILKFGYDNIQIVNNDDLKTLFVKFDISDVDYTQLRNQHLNSLDMELRREIITMKEQDQKYRIGGRSNEDVQNQNKIDSVNTLKMIDVFEKIGFPNKNVIGGFNIDDTHVNCSTILLHTKDSIRLSYFAPKIKEFISKGTASPKLYGTLIDQYFIYKNQEQYYGTYKNSPISSITVNELNKRRKEIGLSNYVYEDWRMEQLYPEQYKLMKEQLKINNN